MKIAEVLYELLYHRDTVVVPGLGAFLNHSVSAKLTTLTDTFSKPSSQIEFDANLREDNDLIVNYIMEKDDLEEEEVRRRLMVFVSDCFKIMKAGNPVILNGIGTLEFDRNETIVFTPDETSNFNSEAFGLNDVVARPVVRAKTKEEIRMEIEEKHKDKNTPITVDEKAVHEGDSTRKPGSVLLWIVSSVVVFSVLLYGIYNLRLVRNDMRTKPQPTEKVEDTVVEIKSDTGANVLPDTVAAVSEEVSSPAPEAPAVSSPTDSEANIRIIAGCYDREEPAQKRVNSLKEMGFGEACMEKRGERWFVAYGRYRTEEEALATLREIRENHGEKGWILK